MSEDSKHFHTSWNQRKSTQLELFLLLYCHNKCLLFIFIAFRLFPSLQRADFCLKRSILSNIISRAGHELLPSSQSRWETKQKKAAQVSYFFTIRCYRIRSDFIRCLRLGCYWIQVSRFGCYRTWIWHIETPFECPSSISRRVPVWLNLAILPFAAIPYGDESRTNILLYVWSLLLELFAHLLNLTLEIPVHWEQLLASKLVIIGLHRPVISSWDLILGQIPNPWYEISVLEAKVKCLANR